MKKIIASLTLYTVFFFCSISLYAVDFGLVYSQDAETNVSDFDFENINYDISGALTPWFTALFGDNGDLYVSTSVNYDADPFEIIPEFTRTDFAFNLGFADIKVGRMFYSDPLGIVANNLFDGAQVSFITTKGNLKAGAWYTGFLYRKRAAITMTDNELKYSFDKVDYNDFSNTYFAPSRILTALEYDHPAIGGIFGIKTSVIGQFDMSDDKLNSQYFTFAVSLLGKSVILDVGGCFELIEYRDKTTPAFAGDASLTFILPTMLEKQIKLSGRYSSGAWEDGSIAAFLPITTVPQGELVEAKLSGLSLLSFDYTGRLAKSLSANMAFTYFIRTDLGTYAYYPITNEVSEDYFLGAEVFGRLIFNISSGIRVDLGTGVFFPQLGDVAPDAAMLWRAKLNLVISIY